MALIKDPVSQKRERGLVFLNRSLTTDQKNMEPPEVYISLRYIFSKLLEIVNLAKQQPEYTG
jgi:hypothetical protein